MKRALLIGLLATGACAPHVAKIEAMPTPSTRSIPKGATIMPSSFATILDAPPAKIVATPRPVRPVGEAGLYARDKKISVAEAQRRLAEQRAALPEFAKLQATLQAREKGNFTAARMIHEPDWAYVFYFKRAPQATLARYTGNPHFKAALAAYTAEELDALVKPWVARFGAEKILGGYGTDATYGTADLMLSVTEDEYREIAARNGWGPVPAAVRLGFAEPLPTPSVAPAVMPLLRAFVGEPRSTVIQLEAGFSGRIILDDGCLRLGKVGGPLVIFHRETGIGLDPEGYLALVDRRTGRPTGRIGEMFSWGGPNGEALAVPGVATLQAKCGPGPVTNVGNPESKAAFDARTAR